METEQTKPMAEETPQCAGASQVPAQKVLVVNDGQVTTAQLAAAVAVLPSLEESTGTRDVGLELSKLQLRPGDVLIVRVPTTTPITYLEKIKGAARAWLNSQGLDKCRLLVLEGGIAMESADLAYMERCGWVRKP